MIRRIDEHWECIVRSQLRRRRLRTDEEEEYEDERNYDEDKVGVGIVASPRSYERRRSGHRLLTDAFMSAL